MFRSLGGHVDGDAQPLLEPRALDVEVRLDDVELASERREFAFGSEHAAQQRRQTQQRLAARAAAPSGSGIRSSSAR